MESSHAVQFRFRGVGLDGRDVGWLQEVIDKGGSLKAAAAEACSRFGWTRPNGQAPIASCSTMFRRLEERGLLKLRKAARGPSGSDREHADRQVFLEALGPVPGMVECQPEGPVTVRPSARPNLI